MDIKEKMTKFNKRWNITSNDSREEAFKKFKTRILNIFKGIDRNITDESITVFCQYYGIEEVWHTQTYSDRSWSTNINDRLSREDNEQEFYRLLEVIFSLDITQSGGYRGEITYSKNLLLKNVLSAVELSDVNLSVIVSGDEVILYPRGEKEFDEELVNFPLSFLNKESSVHFIDALKFYQGKNWVKSAESLRRALEEFLRVKLKNKSGLQANIAALGKSLKDEKSPAQTRNIIFQVFNYIDLYFNDNSKHNDGDLREVDSEFLIYQIGLLLRYIEKYVR